MVVAGSAYSLERKPTASQAFFLLFTYTLDAGSSPTIITARPGLMPFFASSKVSKRTCSFTSAETFFPSIIIAIFHIPLFSKNYQQNNSCQENTS